MRSSLETEESEEGKGLRKYPGSTNPAPTVAENSDNDAAIILIMLKMD
jgi:hypothetical protein